MSSEMRPSGRTAFFGSIRARLAEGVILFGVALAALCAVMMWFQTREIHGGREDQVRVAVEVAVNAIDQQYQEFKAGKISEAEAQTRAKNVLRASRYNADDYLFAIDDDVVIVAHPRADQEGVDGSKQADPTGKRFFVEMHEVASERGAGFVSYEYPKPGAPATQPSPKLSYVKMFAPWKWVVGSGVYIDDLDAKIRKQLLISGGLVLLLLATIGLIGALVAFGLSNRLTALSGAMTRLAAGDYDAALPEVRGGDEVDQMVAAVHVFQVAGREKARLEASAEAARRQAEATRAAVEKERAERERSLQLATEALEIGLDKLASGDLAYRIESALDPKLDKLRLDFNQSLDRLRQTMAGIRDNADTIAAGAREISTAAPDFSKRTERDAANLQTTSAVINEITGTVRKTADGAQRANSAIAKAMSDASSSGAVVREAVAAMDAIERSSAQIGQIIGVIDEIAFQTNLLALNAGVEAARAGEAGRGFAVVASEVRGLAQRATEAARQIKTLIASSRAQVEQGVTVVGRNGQALESIARQIAEMSGVIEAIARAAEDQASSLAQVNRSVSELDQGTQSSAAMVEQTTAAARSLSEQTAEMAELIGRFRLEQGAARRRAA